MTRRRNDFVDLTSCRGLDNSDFVLVSGEEERGRSSLFCHMKRDGNEPHSTDATIQHILMYPRPCPRSVMAGERAGEGL